LAADGRSMWSDPIPAVRASFSFFAFATRSAVRNAGWKGVEISCTKYTFRVNTRKSRELLRRLSTCLSKKVWDIKGGVGGGCGEGYVH
jgi:hypothetical protein